ncbi:hypothetical protein B0H16DRAFT_1671686 [Mycena metata]|uniref:RRM domain-containing protein n=1 Tax=Mycena metata TaxID=1033252 RepID=A0AAD7K9Z7_9AGAR|nr:hypothetical protein B0H16DRAFT_1671686 [Mycena metata]
MSDAPAAPVTENGAPPVTQEKPEVPGFKVFAGNLAYSTTDEGLKTFFAPVQSDILSVQVILRGTRSAGYGFVALATAEAAQKAVELLDKKDLDGRPVIVEVAKPSEQKDKEKKEKKAKRRPGRRGSKAVPGEVSEAEANGDAPKAEAAAAPDSDEAAKPKKKKKKSTRKPKAAKEGEEDAPAAAPVEGEAAPADAATKKAPRVRKPKAPRPPRPAGEDPVGEQSKTMLFVANLGFNIDDAGLSALFTDAGIAVTSARIVRRRWGQPRKSKGYGFVDVGGEEEQKKAIAALEGKELGGRQIAVKIAREIESRTEGLSKSLFERAKEEEDAGLVSGNKALGIMMKMGFKPGQALGKPDDHPVLQPPDAPVDNTPPDEPIAGPSNPADSSANPRRLQHKVEPLPINEWAGKRGIGLGMKRPRSPTSAERVAKMAKMADDTDHRDFRDRAKQEYEERRAEGRLGRFSFFVIASLRIMTDICSAPAQRTCASLDEKAGKLFNVLWLNPRDLDSFPAGLLDALNLHSPLEIKPLPSKRDRDRDYQSVSIEARLRRQMAADTLQPLSALDDDVNSIAVAAPPEFSSEVLEETSHFLRLRAPDQLQLVLSYLRDNYAYCFWCGTRYENSEEMESQCPGEDEDSHD